MNDQIKNLMPEENRKARKREMAALRNKWQKTGLLEGLNSEYEKDAMSQLLQNQAKRLVVESNYTNTVAGGEEWNGIALPLVRRIFDDISAKEFINTQPMNKPSGLVFWLEFKYGTGQPGYNTGETRRSQEDSIYGVTDATRGNEVGTGGFYGVGRFGYTMNDYSSSAMYVSESVGSSGYDAGSGSVETLSNFQLDLDFDTEFSASVAKDPTAFKWLEVPVSNLGNPDLTGIRAFTVSGTGIEDLFQRYTKLAGNRSRVAFLVSGSVESASDVVIKYHKQPTNITRGDFEENKTQEDPLDIPQLNLQMHQEEINAKTRKLKAVWTPEFSQDLEEYHAIDAEKELTGILGEFISQEINIELIDMLIEGAQTVDFWSAKVGYQFDATAQTFAQTSANASAYNQGSWFQTLGTKIRKISNEVDRLTLRGGVNFIVTSPKISTILESIPGYAAQTDGNKDQYTMGVRQVGAITGGIKVFKNPYMTENLMLMGYNGSNFLEAGATYNPYIPLITTPLIHDPDNFTPRKAVMTRYAKKMLRPEFYAKLFISDLDVI